MNTLYKIALSLCCSSMLALSGCGGGGSSGGGNTGNNGGNPQPPETPYATISGFSATDYPLANATVTASCKGKANFIHGDIKTDSQGHWSGQVERSKLPCALRVTWGPQSYHSYALGAGHVNITPFTDLAIAYETKQAPSIWFDHYGKPLSAAQLAHANTTLLEKLQKASYVLPTPFDVFTSPMTYQGTAGTALSALVASIKKDVSNRRTKLFLADYTSFAYQFHKKTPYLPTLPIATYTTPACQSLNLPSAWPEELGPYMHQFNAGGSAVFYTELFKYDYAGQYAPVFKATYKSMPSTRITEFCGPIINNGATSYVIMTDVANVTLSKDSNGKFSASSAAFGQPPVSFAADQGSPGNPAYPCDWLEDDLLIFNSNTTNLCKFKKVTSTATAGVYRFFRADLSQTITITVDNNTVKSLVISDKDSAIRWACGVSNMPACQGIQFSTINNGATKLFTFNDTQLIFNADPTQFVTIKHGTLFHNVADDDPAPLPIDATSCKNLGFCQATAVANFSFNGLVDPITKDTCQLSINNGVFSLSSANKTITATLDGELLDSIVTVIRDEEGLEEKDVYATNSLLTNTNSFLVSKVVIYTRNDKILNAIGTTYTPEIPATAISTINCTSPTFFP